MAYLKYRIIGATIRIEASSLCQLKCPECSFSKGDIGIIGLGYLRFDDFKKIIDANPHIRNVELSNMGEIFLNPELLRILEFAYEKKVNLMALNGVNFNHVTEETLEGLVKYGFKIMRIAIDGASIQTYEIYRKGGDFDKVIHNIKRINYYKQKYGKKFPMLVWQFVIFGHNEHELSTARKMAEELHMSFMPRLNWNPQYSPIKNEARVKSEAGFASDPKYSARSHRDQMLLCHQLWDSPQINWDGKLLGCCRNKTVDFGNVLEFGLAKCLKSKKYRYARKVLSGRAVPGKDIPCISCDTYGQVGLNPIKPIKQISLRLLAVIKYL